MQPYLLHHAVEAAARTHSNLTAILSDDGAITYGEIDRRSNGLARALQAAGVRPGEPVAIAMRKSAAAIVAMLGILKAGAIYVPLDPLAPSVRRHSFIEDCGARALIADADIAARDGWAGDESMPSKSDSHGAAPALDLLITRGKAATTCATRAKQALAWEDSSRPADALPPATVERVSSDTAYVLYTSGSTGTPKGVMLSHAHALNFISWARDEFELGAGDRVSSHAPFHFDLSIFDIFATLSSGATVCLLDSVSARFPAAVASWIERHRITVWYSVPSALIALLPFVAAARCDLNSIRAVLFAGEVFPIPQLRQWVERLPAARFFNLYGPTETNVCTWYRVPADPAQIPDPLPIGIACPNFHLEILDDNAAPAERGYLWASGPAILSGYWGDVDRTRAVTMRRTGRGGEQQVLYNTGDIVSRDAGGNFLYHGRRDALVKCRGYRISLLEVEQAILADHRVAQAAVVAVAHPTETSRLHAFVRPQPGKTLTPAALHAFCASRLPAYMIPESFDIRDTLPQTSTGKLNRLALQVEGTP